VIGSWRPPSPIANIKQMIRRKAPPFSSGVHHAQRKPAGGCRNSRMHRRGVLGLVAGTGLAPIAEQLISPVRIPYQNLPGFPDPAFSGAESEVLVGALGTARVAVVKGRALYHQTHDMAAMRVPLETLKLLGAEAVVLVNTAGSTRTDLARPRRDQGPHQSHGAQSAAQRARREPLHRHERSL
jgi:hypothetical protein